MSEQFTPGGEKPKKEKKIKKGKSLENTFESPKDYIDDFGNNLVMVDFY